MEWSDIELLVLLRVQHGTLQQLLQMVYQIMFDILNKRRPHQLFNKLKKMLTQHFRELNKLDIFINEKSSQVFHDKIKLQFLHLYNLVILLKDIVLKRKSKKIVLRNLLLLDDLLRLESTHDILYVLNCLREYCGNKYLNMTERIQILTKQINKSFRKQKRRRNHEGYKLTKIITSNNKQKRNRDKILHLAVMIQKTTTKANNFMTTLDNEIDYYQSQLVSAVV